MTFDEVAARFKPGYTARRPSWEERFTLQQVEGDVIRLRDRTCPSFGPPWRNSGYDGKADDYILVEYDLRKAATPAMV